MTRILVVEDEYIIAANLQDNLESLGYDVLGIASSGEEAIEKALTLYPDLVLMDILLQGSIDGIQAADQIWKQQQIPVIYVTGHADTSTVEQAKETLPFGYILKPVKGKELYVAIETALNRYQHEQLLTTVLTSISDGLIVTNTQGQILFINYSASQLTGWPQEMVKGRKLPVVFNIVHEDMHLPLDNVAMTVVHQDTSIFSSDRLLLITKQQTTLPIAFSAAPIKNHKGHITGVVLIFRDNTLDRLKADQSMVREQTRDFQNQTQELERLNELKDNFLTMVSRELRSPVANIKAAIQTLEETLDLHGKWSETSEPDSARLLNGLSAIRHQNGKEPHSLNKLIEAQPDQAQNLAPIWLPIHLDEWILEMVAVFQQRAQRRKQHLQVLASPNLPVIISDVGILIKIFTELLTNACVYTPPKGTITVSVEAERGAESLKPTVKHHKASQSSHSSVIQIRVCNSGVEIPAEKLPLLFDNSEAKSGLPLVKAQVAALGGSIWAESGGGETGFIVELPLVPPHRST